MSSLLRVDPSRTTLLRRRWERSLAVDFVELMRRLRLLVVEADALGLKDRVPGLFNQQEDWRLLSPETRIAAFSAWLANELQQTVSKEIAGEVAGHIEAAFQRGLERAFTDVRRSEQVLDLPGMEGKQHTFFSRQREFSQATIASPTARETTGLLVSAATASMSSMANDLSARLSRTVADGILRGDSPTDLARVLSSQANISVNRAKMIARTEIIRAHSEGVLIGLEQLGVTEIGVLVEWTTTAGACPLCAPLQGVLLTTKTARGMFPRHPNCRCVPIPANLGESTKGQKRSRGQIAAAIRRSIKAEMPNKSDRSVETQRRKSPWAGATKRLPRRIPDSIFE